jgi:predicted NBD/HSP70 family sugar kinase
MTALGLDLGGTKLLAGVVEADGTVLARTEAQADDIDGITRVHDAPRGLLSPGTIAEVELTDVVDDFDFAARFARVVHAPTAVGRERPYRSLPVFASSVGSYGR